MGGLVGITGRSTFGVSIIRHIRWGVKLGVVSAAANTRVTTIMKLSSSLEAQEVLIVREAGNPMADGVFDLTHSDGSQVGSREDSGFQVGLLLVIGDEVSRIGEGIMIKFKEFIKVQKEGHLAFPPSAIQSGVNYEGHEVALVHLASSRHDSILL